ncbi:MAG: hypothetical protein AAGH40_12925 [Verrucomicrobiota bacterium]
MKMNRFKNILSIGVSTFLFSIASAHDEHGPDFKEEVTYENGEKIVVKTFYGHVDYKEEYEVIKAKWDKRQESWDAREKKHREEIRRIRERVEFDTEQYDRIQRLLGKRLWAQSSDESLQESAIRMARGAFPSEEMLMEYSFLFRKFPEDGAGLKLNRRSYALLLLRHGIIERGMTLREIESVVGEPSNSIEVDEAEFIVYNMYPDKNHALLLEIEDKKITEIHFGNRDGSNLKLFELHPQLQK